MNNFDFHVFLGAGGAPLIERTVQMLRVQFRLGSWVAPWLALLFSVGEQYALSTYFHFSNGQMLTALAATLLTVWHVHEVSK